ncbi:MAG: hypothetical protein Q4D62_05430 [Planctomycetia bacterium]|nr:hypothetical protein [Planctomycetia bacterium]
MLKSFTTNVCRGESDRYAEQGNHLGKGQRYDDCTANPRLKFDFGLSFFSSQFQIPHEFTKISDTGDWDGDDYDVTVSMISLLPAPSRERKRDSVTSRGG